MYWCSAFQCAQCYIELYVLNIWRGKQILISVFLLCDGALTKSIMTKSSCGCPALWVELFECRLPCKGDEGAGDRGGCTCKQKNTTKSHTHKPIRRQWTMHSKYGCFFLSIPLGRSPPGHRLLERMQQKEDPNWLLSPELHTHTTH